MQGSGTHDTGGVDSGYAWARLGLSMFLATIGGAGMWSVVVVLPAVEREFGVDRADASLPYTATMIGFALGNLFIGRFVDRLGVMVPLALASVLLGSGFLLASQASSIWIFTVLQGAMIGFGSAATFGPLLADVSHWFAKRRGLAVSATASGNYFAGAIWPLVLQAAMTEYGWRGAYILGGLRLSCRAGADGLPAAPAGAAHGHRGAPCRAAAAGAHDAAVARRAAVPADPRRARLLRRHVDAAGSYRRLLRRSRLRRGARGGNAFADAGRRHRQPLDLRRAGRQDRRPADVADRGCAAVPRTVPLHPL